MLEDRIDAGPDWRPYEPEKRHTGAPLSEAIHDRGLGAEIGAGSGDAAGGRLSPEQASTFKRLKKWDRRLSNHERRLVSVFQALARTCCKLGLPVYVKERAALLFRKIPKEHLSGCSVECVAAALAYFVCREFGIRRSLREFAAECGVGREKLKSIYSVLARCSPLQAPPVSPSYYLNEIAAKLGVGGAALQQVIGQLKAAHVASEREALKALSAAVFRAT
ncbi:MAG: hypothetical protein QXQ66_03675, partial [Candidatus Hadarchaeum sp.]|uniref:hypothetical protein n=1 Tax=Candidatus Hadarchaeum sp. TaxID=2883567 RepID=UPI003181BEDC